MTLPLYTGAKATTLYLFNPQNALSLLDWNNFQNTFNQFSLQYPMNTFHLLSSSDSNLANFFNVKASPALLIFKDGKLQYSEEASSIMKDSTQSL